MSDEDRRARRPGRSQPDSLDAAERLRFIQRAQAAGLSLKNIRQILEIGDAGQESCGQVRRVLAARLDHVRTQIAELITLETHLEVLLEHSTRREPTDHATATVCWILETEPRRRAMEITAWTSR